VRLRLVPWGITTDTFAINPGLGIPAAQAWLVTIHRL
jgi:hypothetical protein